MTNSVSNVPGVPVYFSFLLNVTVNPTLTNEFMATMISSTASNTPDPTDPLSLHARQGGDTTHYDLGIERLNGTTTWTGDLADDTNYLVVVKYTFGAAASCNLYVNPTPGGGEPLQPQASATSDGVTAEPADIGTVLFYRAGSAVTYLTSGTYQYDVMRADTNWYNATPPATGAPAGATKLVFSPGGQTIATGSNSALITVTLEDQSNNVFTATSSTVVGLSSTSGGGTFLSGVDGTTVISSVTISNGTSTATFYYNDRVVGNPTISGANSLLTPATQLETVTSSPPSFPPGSIARLSDGNISLTATGALGTPYRLWGSTNVALKPVTTTWSLLNSGTISVSPFTNFDLAATNYPQRFYLFTSP